MAGNRRADAADTAATTTTAPLMHRKRLMMWQNRTAIGSKFVSATDEHSRAIRDERDRRQSREGSGGISGRNPIKCTQIFGVRRHVAAFKARTCPRTPKGCATHSPLLADFFVSSPRRIGDFWPLCEPRGFPRACERESHPQPRQVNSYIISGL